MNPFNDDNLFQDLLATLENQERLKSQRVAPKPKEKTFDKIQFCETFTLYGEQWVKISNRLRENLQTGERVFTSFNQMVKVYPDGVFYPNGKSVKPELIEL